MCLIIKAPCPVFFAKNRWRVIVWLSGSQLIAMPRARSRRFSRRRPTRGKRRFTRRRRSVRRVGRASARSATQGDRGGILNRVGREKPVRLKSMIVGANQQNVSAGTTLATNFVFDPSNSVIFAHVYRFQHGCCSWVLYLRCAVRVLQGAVYQDPHASVLFGHRVGD